MHFLSANEIHRGLGRGEPTGSREATCWSPSWTRAARRLPERHDWNFGSDMLADDFWQLKMQPPKFKEVRVSTDNSLFVLST
jgi:hypothetical protein